MSSTTNKSDLLRKIHKSKVTDDQITIFSQITNLINENNKLKMTIEDLKYQKAVSKLNYDNLQDKYARLIKNIEKINIDIFDDECYCYEKKCTKLDGIDCCGDPDCCEEAWRF